MNRLPEEIADSFFENRAKFFEMKQNWSKRFASLPIYTQNAPEHFLLYLALQGKDWRKAFTPVGERKLSKGRQFQLDHALWQIHLYHEGSVNYGRMIERLSPEMIENLRVFQDAHLLKPFKNAVTREGLAKVRRVLPKTYTSFDELQAYELNL